MFGSFLLSATIAAAPQADLVAAAAATGRPPVCRPASAKRSDAPGGSGSIWTTARAPALRGYCRLLARAQARLEDDPADAAKAAEAAEALLPGRPAPKVVLARIALAQGDAKKSLTLFETALDIAPRSVDQPAAMHDLALARRAAGRLSEALETYRVLAPRVALLPRRADRARVLLEAAHVAMAAPTKTDAEASRHLSEALAYLRQAQRDPHQPLRRDIALSLVLMLDRAGRRAQADAVLAEQRGSLTGSVAADASALRYLVHEPERDLLRALALEAREPAAARAAYDRYLTAAPRGAYATTARERRARLEPAPRRRRRRPR